MTEALPYGSYFHEVRRPQPDTEPSGSREWMEHARAELVAALPHLPQEAKSRTERLIESIPFIPVRPWISVEQ